MGEDPISILGIFKHLFIDFSNEPAPVTWAHLPWLSILNLLLFMFILNLHNVLLVCQVSGLNQESVNYILQAIFIGPMS